MTRCNMCKVSKWVRVLLTLIEARTRGDDAVQHEQRKMETGQGFRQPVRSGCYS
jgi:hypothetical protein